MGAATAALEVRDLRKSFGGVRAVDGVDLTVKSGTVHGLIGPNGAGKTTVFNLITGQIRPERGRVLFNGSDITREAPHRIVRRGLIRTFQSAQLFPQMTVLENVRMGMHWRTRSGILDAILPGLGARGEETSVTEQALETLAFAGLVQIQDALASSLPYGVQRLVEVARALVGYPSLLLLDEPAAGLDTRESGQLAELIGRISAYGASVFIIEHDMNFVLSVCDTITVLDHGRVISTGTPDDVRVDQRVLDAYLGRWEFGDAAD